VNLYFISFLKLRENHEKFVEKVDYYSLISLPGSGFRIWIRIQPGDLNPDPPGSGSETLVRGRYLHIRVHVRGRYMLGVRAC